MTLREIYRIALAENLSAKQAAEKFGVNHKSVSKIKTRHNMPPLRDEWDVKIEQSLLKMSERQLESYLKILALPKNARHSRELRVCRELIEKRKNVLGVS